MTRLSRTMLALLTASAVAACDNAAGDFCAVVAAPYAFDPATAAAMVRTDRAAVVRLDAQNAYWRAHCRD